jgi:hypothetical protein
VVDIIPIRVTAEMQEFYKELLKSSGITDAGRVTISPYCKQGDFTIVVPGPGGFLNNFFDIGNVDAGNIDQANIGAHLGRSCYHGSLKLLDSYGAIAGGSSTVNNWLSTGPTAATISWQYTYQIAAAVDSTKTPLVFDDCFFRFLRKQVAPTGSATHNTEWFFHGLRIDY